MTIKKKILLIIFLLLLLFNILSIIISIKSVFPNAIVSKDVWITSELMEDVGNDTTTYYYTYDDHNGKKGRIVCMGNENLKIGDKIHVYTNSYFSNVSSPDWKININIAKRQGFVYLFVFILFTLANIFILCYILKKKI